MVYGINGRELGAVAKVGIYSPDFRKLEAHRKDEAPQVVPLQKPLHYDRMIRIAEDISRRFPHVRVDLYNVNGRIYFGELTFYDGSGYMVYTPDSFDIEIGGYFPTNWNKEYRV